MAAPLGIRGTFYDLVDDPWRLELDSPDVNRAARFVADGLLVVEDGLIRDFGAWSDLGAKYAELPVTAFPDRVIVPGFIDGHVHFPQTRVIGGYGASLLEWLATYVFPEELKYADPAYAREGARRFVDDLLAAGTTTFHSFCTTSPESVIALFDEADRRHLRALAGLTGLDRLAPQEYLHTAREFYDGSKELIARYHGKNRLLYSITPRFALGCSHELLDSCRRLKAEHPDCWVNTHLSETLPEVRATLERFPEQQDYLGVYERYGLVGPKFAAGHSIHLSESEFQRLHDSGACAVFCPCSNLWLGSGLFPLDRATDPARPVLLALGSDVGAGNTFSMLRVMSDAYKVGMLHDGMARDAAAPDEARAAAARRNKVSAGKAFYLATLGGARALRLDPWLGNFTPGKEADFVVLDPTAGPPELAWNQSRIQADDSPRTLSQCAESLFALVAMGDDRAVAETWVYGKRAYRRG